MGGGRGGGGEESRPRVVSREPLGPAGFRWLSVARLKVLLPPPPHRVPRPGGCSSANKGGATVCSPEPRRRERSLTTDPVRGRQGEAAGLGIRGSAEPERRGRRGRSPRSDPVRPQGDEDGDHRAVPPADRCRGPRGRHTSPGPPPSWRLTAPSPSMAAPGGARRSGRIPGRGGGPRAPGGDGLLGAGRGVLPDTLLRARHHGGQQ